VGRCRYGRLRPVAFVHTYTLFIVGRFCEQEPCPEQKRALLTFLTTACFTCLSSSTLNEYRTSDSFTDLLYRHVQVCEGDGDLGAPVGGSHRQADRRLRLRLALSSD